jgi:hypothetical protein
VEVIARIASITNVHRWSKAGVMIREGLDAGARHAFALVSAGSGYAFQRRPEPDNWSESSGGGAGIPPGWVRLVRRGTTFQAFRSADGRTWTSMGTDTIAMNATVYVGIAVTSHNATTMTTVRADNFRAIAAATTNLPPTVSVTSPADAATFTAPATIAMTASASDPEGRLARVEFFANGASIGSDTTSPFGASMSAVPAGTYALTAVAHDADGASGSSAPRSVTVATGDPAPPAAPRLVAFTASADHATSVTSYLLEVFASSANPATATPVAASDLGKPSPGTSGEISVDRSAFFSALPVGSYMATVTAIGPGGRTRSAAVTFTR